MPVHIASKNFSPRRLLIIGAVLLLVSLAVYFLFKNLISRDAVGLSSQQQELVEQFGYPNTFTLIFGEMTVEGEYQPVRFETWNYNDIGRRFYFIDGQFVKDVDIPFIEKARYPNLRPTWFGKDMTFDQIKKVIGTEPLVSAELIPEIMENGKIYDFWGQVRVGEVDGKIVYLRTYPVVVEETGENEGE